MLWCSACQRGCVGLLRCRKLSSLRCALLPPRSFSTSPCVRSIVTGACGEKNKPLKQWSLVVDPFSTVRAQLPCSISVHPLDPHSFPEADRAFVSLHGGDTGSGVQLDRLHVHYDAQSKELFISGDELDCSLSVELTAPIKSNLYITTQGKGNVQVKKMECDICRVKTDEGNCLLHSVKGHQVEVQSHAGHVTGVGTIHGNVDISTCGQSSVDVKKLQGTTMNVSTENGSLKVKAIYAESSSVSSRSGRVELGNVHGDATVKTLSGDIVIDGSNSFLKVSSRSGAVDVYVGDGGSAEVHSQEGTVCVRVPSSLSAGLELYGASVEIGPDVDLHGLEQSTAQGQTTVSGRLNGESQTEQTVKAQADRGSVTLKTQSWFESLKLGS
ncbi:protein FAM185A [Genypterus blacodes]|uniref:protein FAM185A n=1 Tax=Genypterus blacodes TaxID=154954 RepID=UPI003F7594FE